MHEVVSELLELEGVLVDAVSNVDEAVLAMRAACFDVLIVEVPLWQLRRALLAGLAPRIQPLASVILTGAWDGPAEAPDGVLFLGKPFSAGALLGALAAALSARSEGPR